MWQDRRRGTCMNGMYMYMYCTSTTCTKQNLNSVMYVQRILLTSSNLGAWAHVNHGALTIIWYLWLQLSIVTHWTRGGSESVSRTSGEAPIVGTKAAQIKDPLGLVSTLRTNSGLSLLKKWSLELSSNWKDVKGVWPKIIQFAYGTLKKMQKEQRSKTVMNEAREGWNSMYIYVYIYRPKSELRVWQWQRQLRDK